ncbi:MAG: aminodeoxychorismate synthase, component I [Verrucomicrobia bacterium]|nr:MAG: aminodeoxychorismate synthase, component I [Verrucomicrobiota bacterium]
MMPRVVIREAADRGTARWLDFVRPARVIRVTCRAEILPALAEVDAAVRRGYWAAGFIAYEAAPAFDPAFVTARPGPLPLLWFGLYRPENVRKAGAQLAAPADVPRHAPTFPRLGKSDASVFQALEKSWKSSVSQSEFSRAIVAIRRAIARGETYQVNYSFRLRAPSTACPCLVSTAGYGAWLDLGDHQICSASPELFFRRDGDRIVCRPMKGTAPRGLTRADDQRLGAELHNSEKNRAENIMIVDMVRNDLGRIARSGSVRVASVFDVERYDTLWQMTSTVTARTRADWPETLRALFPCASITGAPKVQTMKLIADLEHTPRGIYTGTIGFISPERHAQFNVAIRTLHLDRERQRLEYGTGAGITWDSRAAGEWQECRTKTLVLASEPPFELLETLLWRPGHGYALLARHLRRMADSAEYFGFAFRRAAVLAGLRTAARKFSAQPQRVRLLLDRIGKLRIEATPLPAFKVWKIALASTPVDWRDRFLYHKTTRRAAYDAALRQHPDCDDVILFNARGEITESCFANVVMERNGQGLTPPVSCGLLAGTQRAELLARGKLTEKTLYVADLLRADRVFLVNSVRGIIETQWDK